MEIITPTYFISRPNDLVAECYSGGGTKAIALVEHALGLRSQGAKFHVSAGISAGGLILLPLILGYGDAVANFSAELTLERMFGSAKPVNEKGRVSIRSVSRMIYTGSLGRYDGLKQNIAYLVSESDFIRYKTDSDLQPIFIGVVNANTEQFSFINLKNCSYEGMIDTLIATCSIPVFTPPVLLRDNLCYYDGGLAYHNPTTPLIRMFKGRLGKVYSVYSRPKELAYPDYGFNGESFGRALLKVFDVQQENTSRKDEEAEKDLAALYKIELVQKYSPSVLRSVYDVDPIRLKELRDCVRAQYYTE